MDRALAWIAAFLRKHGSCHNMRSLVAFSDPRICSKAPNNLDCELARFQHEDQGSRIIGRRRVGYASDR